MEGFGSAQRHRQKKRLVAVFFLFFSVGFLHAGQEPDLILPEEPVRVDQRFTLVFRVETSDPEDVRVRFDAEFPDSVTVLAGPNILPATEKDPVTGRVERAVLVQYVFRAVRAGRSVIEPLSYSVRNEEFFTLPAILEIAEKRGLPHVPFAVEWNSSARRVFEGQAVPIVLEMFNLPSITVPESVSITSPKQVVFEKVKGLGTVVSRKIGSKEIFRIPIDSYMLTPSSPGRVVLPSAKVKSQGMTIDSKSLTIDVLPLPESVRSTGAIGKFRVVYRLDKADLLLGEPFELVTRIEGEGNLNYLQFPEAEFEGIVLTGKSISSSYIPFEKGYRGSVESTIRLSPQRAGSYQLKMPSFSYIDSESGQIMESGSRILSLRVREKKGAVSGPEKNQKYPELIPSDRVLGYDPLNAASRPVFYLLLLPGIFIFAAGLLKKKQMWLFLSLAATVFFVSASEPAAGNDVLGFLKKGEQAFLEKDYPLALKNFTSALDGHQRSPGIHYNLGIVHFAAENTAFAVYHLRRAAWLRPGTAVFRDAAAAVEKQAGLSRQTPLPTIHPDVFFWIFLCIFTLAGLVPFAVKSRSSLLILSILFFMTALVFFGMTLGTAALQNMPQGVVGPGDTELKKIPVRGSSEWLFLTEGTAVRIRGATNGYVIVRTGFGVEGWLLNEKIIRDQGTEGEKRKQ